MVDWSRVWNASLELFKSLSSELDGWHLLVEKTQRMTNWYREVIWWLTENHSITYVGGTDTRCANHGHGLDKATAYTHCTYCSALPPINCRTATMMWTYVLSALSLTLYPAFSHVTSCTEMACVRYTLEQCMFIYDTYVMSRHVREVMRGFWCEF